MSDFSDAQLSEFKHQLLDIKNQLSLVLSGQHEKAEPVQLDQQSVGRVSRIDAIQQQQMAKAGEVQTSRRLILVNAALARFDSDDYGYCLQCDEPIARARLAIMPEAEYCIGCQAEHDS